MKTFKFRIYPTKHQTSFLEFTLEECRYLYNKLLEQRKYAWEIQGVSLNLKIQQKLLPSLKRFHQNFKIINAAVLQNVNSRVDFAFKSFFKRVKSGGKPGYPRFKGKGNYDSITFPQVPKGCQIKNEKLVVDKIGHIKIKQHRKLEGKPKTATIKRSHTGKWYVTFICEVERKVLPFNKNKVGIDVGIKSFAVLSDNTSINNPKFFRNEEKELVRIQRRFDKTKKGTIERIKRKKVVSRIHERIRFKRENFIHQESRKIVDNYGIICVEDLTITRMVKNHNLAKSIADAAWSGFFNKLSYKAESAGRLFVKVNPAYTSRDCHKCGNRQKLTLADRIYDCPVCGLHIDRDLNSSFNILRLGMQSLNLRSESP
jgi:putative transposase